MNEKDREYYYGIYSKYHVFKKINNRENLTCEACLNGLECIKQEIEACTFVYPTFSNVIFEEESANLIKCYPGFDARGKVQIVKYPLIEHITNEFKFNFVDENYDDCEWEFQLKYALNMNDK